VPEVCLWIFVKSFWDDSDGALVELTDVLLLDFIIRAECFGRELLLIFR
jgi:hypothetical protein